MSKIIEKWLVGPGIGVDLECVKAKFAVGEKTTRLVKEDSPSYRRASSLMRYRTIVTQPLYDSEAEALVVIHKLLKGRVESAELSLAARKRDLAIFEERTKHGV